MDSHILNSTMDPQMSPQRPNRPSGSVRQPVSCEPCRRRKIRCSRTRPPCDTCRRRACSESCFYKKTGTHDGIPSSFSNGTNEELLNRISNLENLLRKHTGAHIPNPAGDGQLTSPMLSPPLDYTPPVETSNLSGPLSSQSPSQISYSSEPVSTRGLGVLTTSPNGDVRYETRSSQWSSVLANTGLSNMTPDIHDPEGSGITDGFPFTSSSAPSVDELLALLPPMQQTEYLKETYFNVFSPVGYLPQIKFKTTLILYQLLHILHDPTFHAQYALFTDYPKSVPISWLAILFILLSLAVTALEESDPVLRDLARGPDACNNIRLLSRRYREAAMKCLAKQGVFWGRHNIQSLQALILLIYAMGHSQDPTWALLGKYAFDLPLAPEQRRSVQSL